MLTSPAVPYALAAVKIEPSAISKGTRCFCGGIAAGLRRVKSPPRGRLERRFEKVRGRHKNSHTGWGFLKNHLVCIVTASSKYRNADRERESLRYRENYMISLDSSVLPEYNDSLLNKMRYRRYI